MKRLFIIVLCFFIMLLGACSSPTPEASAADTSLPDSTQPQETTSDGPAETEAVVYTSAPPASEKTRPVISASSTTLCAGNFDMPIPEGFSLISLEENYAALVSEDKDCVIGIFVADISELDEEKAKAYLPIVESNFATEGAVRANDSTSPFSMGPFDLVMNIYSEDNPEVGITANMDSVFTDSWYVYAIMFRCDIESTMTSEFVRAFTEFIGYAEYSGSSQRFDFVQ